MDLLFDFSMWLLVLLLTAGYFYLVFWVGRDAGRNGRSGLLWGVLTFVNPILFGLIYYILVREAPRQIPLSELGDRDTDELRTDSEVDRLVDVLTRTGWSHGITTYRDEYGQDWTQIDATRGDETKMWRWKTGEHIGSRRSDDA